MKILYILKGEPDDTTKKIIEVQSSGNEVKSIDITKEKDYERIVKEIEEADKVITW